MKKFVCLIAGLVIGLSGVASANQDKTGEYSYFTQGKNITNLNTQLPARRGLLRVQENEVKSSGNYLSVESAPRSHLKIDVEVNMTGNVLTVKYGADQNVQELSGRIPVSQQLFQEVMTGTHVYLVLPEKLVINGETQTIDAVDNVTEKEISLRACSPENTELSRLLMKYNASIEGTYDLSDDDRTQLEMAFDNSTGFFGKHGKAADLVKGAVKYGMDSRDKEMIEKLREKYGAGYVVYKVPYYVPEGISMMYSHLGREISLNFDSSKLEKDDKIFVEIPNLTFEVNMAGAVRRASLEGMAYEVGVGIVENIHNVALPKSLKSNDNCLFALVDIGSIKPGQLYEMLPTGNSLVAEVRNEILGLEEFVQGLRDVASFIYFVSDPVGNYGIGIKIKPDSSYDDIFEFLFDLSPKCKGCEYSGYEVEDDWFIYRKLPDSSVDIDSSDWHLPLILAAPRDSQFVAGVRVTPRALSEIKESVDEDFGANEINSIRKRLPLMSALDILSVGQWGLVSGKLGLDGHLSFSIGTNDVGSSQTIKNLYDKSIDNFSGYLDGLNIFSKVVKDIRTAIGIVDIRREGDKFLLQVSNEKIISFLSHLASYENYFEFEDFGEDLEKWIFGQVEEVGINHRTVFGQFKNHPRYGRIYIVRGKIKNQHDTSNEIPKIICEFRGKKSRTYGRVYVGCLMEDDEVFRYSKREVSDKLRECSKSHQNISANSELPFMVILFNIPKSPRNFKFNTY